MVFCHDEAYDAGLLGTDTLALSIFFGFFHKGVMFGINCYQKKAEATAIGQSIADESASVVIANGCCWASF